jgi:DNA-binding Lrp family transcriptional regulator
MNKQIKTRQEQVLEVYRCYGCSLTDREVMRHLGFIDMNTVRPSITRLVKKGVLKAVKSLVDDATGVTVRACVAA